MPAKGIDHYFKTEAANFNEDFLRDYVQIAQSRPDDPTDAAALQRMISTQQAFLNKWKRDDFLKTSRDALDTLRTWANVVEDKALSANVSAKVAQISEQHATTLRQKYFGSPQLLSDAMDYYRLPVSDNSLVENKLAAVRAQAMKLGDEANAKNRYELAGAYYDVADADDKADAVRERGRQVAMKKMQPADRSDAQAGGCDGEGVQRPGEDRGDAEAGSGGAEGGAGTAGWAPRLANQKGAADLEKELGL